mmetsp:Transcript_16177/g.41627  ORF Transcript_16177/g.41627 Transcript_16177/m.41627 type:complete len:338 (+) Transcript_16177:53-1066(+)
MGLQWLVALLAAGLGGARGFDVEGNRIKGVMAATYTPMKNGGMELDLTKVKPYAAHLASINVTHAMPAGTSGESVSLTVSERKQLAEEWAKVAPGIGVKVYIHVGAESLLDAIELARHAATLPGVSGIVCMPPVYFKPSLETLHDFLAAVSGAAPALPIWYYHIPVFTGVLQGRAHELLQLAEKTGKLPKLMGIKFTDYDLADFTACLQVANGKYNLLFGRDDKGLSALMLGCDGVVSSTVNYSPTLREVVQLYAKGDLRGAAAAQQKNADLCDTFGPYGLDAKNVQKAIMRMVGVDVGPSRLPYQDLTPSEYAALEAKLQSKGFIDTEPLAGASRV